MMSSGCAFQMNGCGLAALYSRKRLDLEIDESMEDSVLHLLRACAAEFGKEALDGIEPRTRAWRASGKSSLDPVKGADLVTVSAYTDHVEAWSTAPSRMQLTTGNESALHVLPDDRSRMLNNREQRGRAVAFVVMGRRPALLHPPGWVRSSAWIVVDRQDHRMGRWNIQADDIGEPRHGVRARFRERCLRPWAFQIGTVDAATPAALAIARNVQWVASCSAVAV